ncbi:MAG: dethiobiotin synthetase [Betaproteobacteria bacterium SG8_40]|nr:MAG: dethiobiotin synthetase [Betaproteobacteria bacterium SG8_40]
MTRSCFVTGTDTEIGKTLIACALLHAYRDKGLTAVGMKPVAAGASRGKAGPVNDDVEALVDASSVAAGRDLVNPYLFADPVAPHIAAAGEQRTIDPSHIVACYRQLAALADVVVVEGVGGFRVPLGERFDTADLACRLALPVVLVVGMRLGCINHALLTAEAIRSRKLVCAGWIANQVDPHMQRQAENIAALDDLLGMPRIGTVEYLRPPDAAVAATRLRLPDQLLAG